MNWLYSRWNSPVVHGSVVTASDCLWCANHGDTGGNRATIIYHMMLHGY